MRLRPLPHWRHIAVESLLIQKNAPPRLIAHLQLVHDVACRLTEMLKEQLPELKFDEEAVLIGAATHDIGKVGHPEELSGPGSAHEESGQALLLEAGFPQYLARFALTHGGPKREPHPTIEDLLVQQSDAIWKGARHHKSEMILVDMICDQIKLPRWKVYQTLDEILTEIGDSAHLRLEWQALHPLT